MSTDAALNAKLDLAVDYGLQAAFTYTNDRGETLKRRLVVEDFDGSAIEGQSFGSDGRLEGYRRFRLDRITGKVAIR